MGPDPAPAVEIDDRLEVLSVPEATAHALDLLNLAVEVLTHRLSDVMLAVGHDVVDVPLKPSLPLH